SGDDLTLCTGQLSDDAADPDQPHRALVAVTPHDARVGESLSVAGLLAFPETFTPSGHEPPLEVRLTDTLDHVLATVTASVDATGLFLAKIPATPAMCGKYLRPQLRRAEKAIESAYRRPLLHVAVRDPALLDVEVSFP